MFATSCWRSWSVSRGRCEMKGQSWRRRCGIVERQRLRDVADTSESKEVKTLRYQQLADPATTRRSPLCLIKVSSNPSWALYSSTQIPHHPSPLVVTSSQPSKPQRRTSLPPAAASSFLSPPFLVPKVHLPTDSIHSLPLELNLDCDVCRPARSAWLSSRTKKRGCSEGDGRSMQNS